MSEPIDQMAPDASPDTAKPRTGVRRVNNLPMYLLGTVLAGFLVVMALVAADRAQHQGQPATPAKEKVGSTATLAKEIAGDRQDGIIEPAKPLIVPDMAGLAVDGKQPGNADTPPVPIARPENLDTPPVPPGGPKPGGAGSMPDEEANRIRMVKLQMFDEAVKAKTGVQVQAPRSAASAQAGRTGGNAPLTRNEIQQRIAEVRQLAEAQRDDPNANFQARLAQYRGMGGPGAGATAGPQLLQTTAPATGRNNIGQFGNAAGGDRWRLDSRPEAPRTPYELRAGFVVPATLISGINSDLPGQIMAQVAQSVYDTPTGKHVLVPQGSRLVGTYSSEVAYGQARVLVAWQRIIFPDGKAMDLGAMPGADGAGYAGFHDQVNNHYLRLFGSAFLMSGITAGITYSQRQNQANNVYGTAPTASSALSEALGQQLGQVTAQLIARNMNIAPTLEIRPGYRFNVVVTKDLTFSKPYQSFDY